MKQNDCIGKLACVLLVKDGKTSGGIILREKSRVKLHVFLLYYVSASYAM